MSRIDEALRRAARTEGTPDRPFDGMRPEPPTSAIDSSILDRFALETPARLRDHVQHVPEPVLRAPQPEAAIRPIAPALASKLVISPDISPQTLEQYRRLAASLHELQTQHGLKSLMVTSARPAE